MSETNTPLPSQFSQEFLLTPGLCNARRELPVYLLTSQIIEIATAHANILGIGFKYMAPLGVGWVLSRYTLEMKRYPVFNEHYKIETWVESWNRHFSTRDFAIIAENGEEIGYARTIWMVIDTNTHANAGTSMLSLPMEVVNSRPCPIEVQKKHAQLPADRVSTYQFRYTDIDFYGHVNTVRYIELLLNQFPLHLYDGKCVGRLEVAFQHEAKYDETVEIHLSEQNDFYALSLHRNTDILLNARLYFRDPQV